MWLIGVALLGWGGSLIARGVLASDRPAWPTHGSTFVLGARLPPLSLTRFNASARRLQS